MTAKQWLLTLTVTGMFLSLPLLAQSVTYKPGGGIQLASPEDAWKFRMLGYVQSTFTAHGQTENQAVGNEFFIRRSRLDVIFDYRDRYQIFFEWDARGSRTEMVLAQLDVRYLGKHTLRIGKYITPFSPENTRSSRSLSTVERYTALNSLFLLPGLDTQYGMMFHARLEALEYYLSITNGNGKASDNLRENNNAKDFQGRLVYHLSDRLQLGASVNYADEEQQLLRLVDHTFAGFNEAHIGGARLGYLLNVEYRSNPLLFRGEVFQYRFDEPLSERQQVESFLGGYFEGGYFLHGNTADGLQLLGRVETAQYGDAHASLFGPRRVTSLLAGSNWYRDGIFRLQINLIYELVDEASPLGTRFEGEDEALTILTMLQLKF